MKLIALIALTLLCVGSSWGTARADTAFFARQGYSYPAQWGIGPFQTLSECSKEASNLYGAYAYKWHCELRTYVGIRDTTPSAPSYPPQQPQKFFARLGYDYPPHWGAGPFSSLQQCTNLITQIYGAKAFRWHCELHL